MLNQSGLSLQSNRGAQAPDMPELHRLLSLALGRRGQHVQTSWHSTDKSSDFVLDVISNTNGGDPKWQLYREHRGNRQLLFDYPSCDVLLVHNFIASSCAEFLANSRAHTKSSHAPIVPDTPPPFMHEQPATATPPTAGGNGAQVISQALPSSGDIAKFPLDQLLDALKAAKMTGKLEIRHYNTTALLYVRDGMPIDATTSDTEGEDAIIELLTWKEGQFTFEPRVLRNSHTVHQPIESLSAQSKQLAERMTYLSTSGMHPNSALIPKSPGLTDLEFVQKAARGAPMDVEEMKKLYRSLDGKKTMEELLRSMRCPRVQLINVLYHLVINGLVGISNEIVLQKPSEVRPRPIEASAIQSVMMNLRSMETGMFIYPAFLYFLEQEYFRCYRSKTPLSVIVFEIRVLGGGSVQQMLSAPAVLDAVLRISQLKRHVDLLAHYDSFDYALLLPNTKANGAQIFAKRIVKALTETPLAGEIDAGRLSLALGCASMPEDFAELSELLGAADLAMSKSRSGKKPVVMYRDIKALTL